MERKTNSRSKFIIWFLICICLAVVLVVVDFVPDVEWIPGAALIGLGLGSVVYAITLRKRVSKAALVWATSFTLLVIVLCLGAWVPSSEHLFPHICKKNVVMRESGRVLIQRRCALGSASDVESYYRKVFLGIFMGKKYPYNG
jgi:predicted nucleic acid-binding Zn ribbon protein